MEISLRTTLLLAGISLIAASPCALAHTDVTVQQARDLIASTPDLIVVDVREPYEYCDARGHIPGALNYPWSSGILRARFEELPADRPILVVCRSGGRSNAAASFLDSNGFSMVYDMLRGMNAWLWETAPCKYSGGSGTPDDPYEIATAEDLITLGETPEDYDKHFIMTADIDLDPNLPGRKVFNRAVIAPDDDSTTYGWFDGDPFTGVFDGNGHVISNLNIAGMRYLGLFGQIQSAAEVKNLGLQNVNIVGSGSWVGGVAAHSHESFLTGCFSAGVISGSAYVGGLVGNNKLGAVIECHSTGSVNGEYRIGGLVGLVEGSDWWGNAGYVANCHSNCTVSGTNWCAGGLVGERVLTGLSP